ncbi:MAG TPA: ion channel [Myxococcaceae bacterium]|nr:ion channel [Myxococcaceae bacterium]
MPAPFKTTPSAAPRIFQRDGRPLLRARDLVGLRRSTLSDVYYFLIAAKWRVVLAIYGAAYLLTNALFALVYRWTGGILNARPGSFADAFFFSAETLGTIGYGVMAPQSLPAHLTATLENMVGLLGLATFTGITFAKFSRPKARVIFSDVAIIAPRNGLPTFSFRVANERVNHVVQARLQVTLVRWELTTEGERFRRMVDLSLARSESPAFVLTWLALHPIDETSPLHGVTPESFAEGKMELLVIFTGWDETLAQTIYARQSYVAGELRWNHRFRDVIQLAADGSREIDYGRFHETEALPAAAVRAASG